MTDPQQKDPLAALEELLQDSKGGTGDAADPQAAEEKQAQETKAAEEQEKKEIAAMEDAQKGKDAEDLRSQIDSLKNITDTPQEQARLEQMEKTKQVEEKKDSDQEEYQIRQLGHTKV